MAEGAETKRRKRSGAAVGRAGGRAHKEASVEDLVAALQGRSTAPDDDEDDAPTGDRDEAPGAEDAEIPDEVKLSDSLPMAPEDDLSDVEGEASTRLVSIVESLLFAADRPMTVKDLRRVLKDPSVRQIQLALKQLIKDTADRGIVLGQVAGGFRLRTHHDNAAWVQRMLAGKPARLSRSQLEALAVIAYRQPITKAEIDHVRGVDCSAVLRVLLERDLVRIVGRKEEPGRPIVYGTTVEFLEFFNLRTLRDMPDLHEFRELTEESRATLRERYGDEAGEVEAEALGQQRLDMDDDADGDAEPVDPPPLDLPPDPEPEPEPEPESEPQP